MSVAYHRFKMRATTVVVDHMRSFCDGCNIVVLAVTRPFKRIAERMHAEAPWVVTIAVCTLVTLVPLVGYPYIKKYVMPDKRAEMEAERVRLCLQKGIDPYPYMRHKDYVYGNNAPVLAKQDQIPEKLGWEFEAIKSFQERKEELRREVGGNVEDTVQKLMEMKAAQKQYYKAQRGHLPVEPKDLIFHGRSDVNELKS